MNRDRILQVRVDTELAHRLRNYLERLQETDPRATESVAVRELLRDALARRGQKIDLAAAARSEGVRRAYAEVREALRGALKPFVASEEER